MSKKIAVVQSNYIPWRGYFDLINLVDEFILFDDAQYTRRDWRNRNVIKTPQGLHWLTIPVQVKGKYLQKIKDTTVTDEGWNHQHWRSIVHNYSQARYFEEYRKQFEELYLGSEDRHLSQINLNFIRAICRMLGISTTISCSMEYDLIEGKTARLVQLSKDAGAIEYVSGPAAKAYLEEDAFRKEGIKVSYMNYSGYPEYHQLYPPFEPNVSIIDLIFNEGPNATSFMRSF